jgi:signal transduction histidine kinase
MSVRMKVLTSVLVMSALGLLLAGATAFVLQGRLIAAEIDDSLVQEVEEFRALAENGVDPETGQPFTSIEQLMRVALQRNVPHDNETYLTFLEGVPFEFDGGDRPIRPEEEPAILDAVAAVPAGSPVAFRDVETAAGAARLAIIPVSIRDAPDAGTYLIAVAVDRERESLLALARLYAVVALVSILLLGIVGWLVAGRLLEPLRQLRESAHRITETDLTERIPVRGNDDISDLTRTYNAMLDRLEEAFEAQRGFLDDAGHELRTPVTVLRGHLELLDSHDPAEVEETRLLLLDEVDRMSRQVEDLILLAKAQRPDFVRPALVHVGVLTDEVLAKASAIGDRPWLSDGEADAWVVADEQRLTQALLQLADNAVKYSPPGSPVSIGSSADAEHARIWVTDRGRGIPVEEQQRIFDRFRRAADVGAVEGSGLGLAIVLAIAEAHGGRVDVSSAQGAGSTFTITLPLAGAEQMDDLEQDHVSVRQEVQV